MIKFGTARKAIAILANVSLLFNSFVPFLLVAQPAYAQSSEVVAPTIEYNQSANKINVKVNTSEKVAYQLFYKTDKIDAIAGNDLALGNFYLGTCSASVCLPQNISRGILKIESGSEFHSQFFTLENNVLTVVKESNSNQSDLTNEENDFLNNISQWTFEKVELNKEYVAPQNSGVKLTFTKLPENSGNIKIEEITLTKEQIEQSGSLSDKAYDITSDMVDGTFAYNLSLPIPESSKGKNVDIKFTEDISQINSAQTANNTTETNSIVSAANLNHFTLFIITGTTPPIASNIIDDGDANFSTNVTWNNYSVGFNGDDKYIANTTGNWARWTFTDEQLPVNNKTYTISTNWVVWNDHVSNATYRLYHSDGTLVSNLGAVDQNKMSNGTGASNGTLSDWYKFSGVFTLQNGDYVQLETDGSNTLNIVADAIKIETASASSEVWVNKNWSSQTVGTDLGSDKVYGYNAFSTIQAAINAVAADGTVNVAAGTYAEHLIINKQISLVGADKNTTIIDGAVAGVGTGIVVTIAASNVTLKNFTIENSGINPLTDAGIGLNGANNCTVNSNIVTGNVTNIAVMSSKGNTISSNTISNSLMYGIVLEAGVPGVYSTGNIISENIINANGRDGIYAGQNNNNNQILNNEITGTIGDSNYGSSPEGNGIYLWKSAGNIVTGNNISSNATGYGIEMYGSKENTITGNEITGNLDGFHIRNIDETNFPGYSIKGNNISNNKIYNNTRVNLYANPNLDFNVENNWWGSPDKTTIVNKLASWTSNGSITAGTTINLDFEPWCVTSDCSVYSDTVLSAPTNLTPTNNTFTNNSSFNNTWSAVNGAVGYEYQTSYSSNISGLGTTIYSDSSAFLPGRYNLTGSTIVRTNITAPDANYYWQVRAISADGTPGNWSGINKVVVDTSAPSIPALVFPNNNDYSTVNNFTFQWNASTDASPLTYEWESSYSNNINEDSSFVGRLASRSNLSTSIYSPGTPNNVYYWHVRAVDSAGNKSVWSVPWEITVDVTAPVGGELTMITKLFPSGIAVTSPDANGVYHLPDLSLDGADVFQSLSIVVSDTNLNTNNVPVYVDTVENGYMHYNAGIWNYEGQTSTPTFGAVTHSLVATFSDKAGNTKQLTARFTTDNIGPLITLDTYSTAPTNQDVTVTASVNEGILNTTSHTFTANGSFDFIATDLAKNTTTKTVTITNIDKDKPYAPIITSPVSGQYFNTNDILNQWSVVTDYSDIANYRVEYKHDTLHNWDSNPYRTTTSNSRIQTPGASMQGGMSFRVQAVDKAGNEGTWSDWVHYYYDITAPSISSKTTFSGWYNTNQTSTFTYTDANGVVSGNDSTCDITTEGSAKTCTVTPNVCDAAGNCNTTPVTSNPANLDFTAPTSTIDGGTNGGTIYSSTWNGSITGTAADNLSGVKEVQLTIQNSTKGYWTGLAWQVGETSVVAVDTTNWTYQIGETLTDGTYTIKSHAIDNADNKENTYTLTIVLDRTIDEVALSIDPTVGDASNGWYRTQPTITLIQTTDVNFDRIEYQWDSQNGSWTSYSTAIKPLTEGAHVLYYRAFDKANNISQVGIKNINWDQTDLEYGPQNITANPNPTSGSTSKIKWEFAKDNTSIDKYEIQWKLNDNNQSLSYSKTVGAGTTEVEIDQLVEGRWTVKVIAFDQSGRTKDNSIDLTVDRTGPVAPILQVTSIGTGTASLAWNAIDDTKDYIIWYGSVQGVHQYGARVGNVTSYTVKGLGAGNYYFIVKAVDAAQNQSNDSNEVNTGTIVGATGSTPGQPAEGFTPEVLGANTEEATPTATPTIELGNILGSSITKGLSNWWWLLLLGIIPLYVVGKKISKKK